MKNVSTGTISPADRTDWDRVRAMTDADICFDGDSPRTTEGDWNGAVMKQNGVPCGRVRGTQKAPTKVQVAIRCDRDVLAAFRATGKGWQTRMNNALREWLASHPAA